MVGSFKVYIVNIREMSYISACRTDPIAAAILVCPSENRRIYPLSKKGECVLGKLKRHGANRKRRRSGQPFDCGDTGSAG